MKLIRTLSSCAVGILAATVLSAQDPEPGSVLIYPSVRETGARTVVSVTNTHPTAPITVRFSYVGVTPSGTGDPFIPDDCQVFDRLELLTPSDTLTVSVLCHNSLAPLDGYLVIDARSTGGTSPISHNYLVGSQFVSQGASATYSLAAISFQSPQPDGFGTDIDGDGELDFDGLEYTTCPETLIIDTFLASIGNRLAMINLTGGTPFVAAAGITVFNDNEVPLSAFVEFRCWFDRPLDTISIVFTLPFLLGTAQDPSEFDIDCDGIGDLETGWAMIRGISATSVDQVITKPALIGAITGTTLGFERGRPLWRQGDNIKGDFLHFTTIHPEY